jgi:hypothetical protein
MVVYERFRRAKVPAHPSVDGQSAIIFVVLTIGRRIYWLHRKCTLGFLIFIVFVVYSNLVSKNGHPDAAVYQIRPQSLNRIEKKAGGSARFYTAKRTILSYWYLLSLVHSSII